jgi:hypothetical protein
MVFFSSVRQAFFKAIIISTSCSALPLGGGAVGRLYLVNCSIDPFSVGHYLLFPSSNLKPLNASFHYPAGAIK